MPLTSSIITAVATVLTLLALYICRRLEEYRKEIREPLSYDLQAHPFVRAVVDFTDQIRTLKTEEEANSFFQKTARQKKLNLEPKSEHYAKNFNFTHFFDRRYADYVTPEIKALIEDRGLAELKLSTIRSLRARWIQFLTGIIAKRDASEEEKQKTASDILAKLIYPFNSDIVRIAKEENIIRAWALVLNDKDLTAESLLRLEKQVESMLASE